MIYLVKGLTQIQICTTGIIPLIYCFFNLVSNKNQGMDCRMIISKTKLIFTQAIYFFK